MSDEETKDRIGEGERGELIVLLHEPIEFTNELGSQSVCKQLTVSRVTLGAIRRTKVDESGEFSVLDLANEITTPRGRMDDIANADDMALLMEAVGRQRKNFQRSAGTTGA